MKGTPEDVKNYQAMYAAIQALADIPDGWIEEYFGGGTPSGVLLAIKYLCEVDRDQIKPENFNRLVAYLPVLGTLLEENEFQTER